MYQSTKTNVNNLNLFASLFFIIVFLVSPFLSFLVAYIYLILGKKETKNISLLFVFLSTIFISFINSESEPRSDMLWYLEDYYDAGSQQSFVEYLFNFGRNGMGRELAFPFFNYIVYIVIGRNQEGYMFVCSCLSYGLLNYAIYRLGKFMKLSETAIISAMMIIIFFPLILTYSMVLMRQFIAGAIFIYVLVERTCYKKKCWLLLIIMVLMHSSSLFFIPFLLLPMLGNPITKKNSLFFILLFFGLLLYQFIASSFLPFFAGNNNVLTYALERASGDTTYDLGEVEPYKVGILVFLLTIPIFLYYFRKKVSSSFDVRIIHLVSILCLFIIVNLHQSELANRFLLYVYFLLPCIYLYLIANSKLINIISIIASTVVVIMFIRYIQNPDIGYISFSKQVFSTTIFHFIF